MISRLFSLYSGLVLLLLSACAGRELCYDHSHKMPVEIEFDWSLAPDASPSAMVVWFFPTDDGQGVRFELSADGGSTRTCFNTTVKVLPGDYRVVCHNGGSENNVENGFVFSNYVITTFDDALLSAMNRGDNAPRPDETEDQPVRAQSDMLFSHTYEREISVSGAGKIPLHIVLTPRVVSCVWNIRITDVSNLTSDVVASAVVTGVAENYSPSLQKCGGAEVTIPFPLSHCGDDCLVGKAVVFGDNSPHDLRHKLRVYTSSKYYYDFDITDQLHSASDPYNVEILLHGIKLPENKGSGMSTDVEDWTDTEEQEIDM